jgi:hypothetical protein
MTMPVRMVSLSIQGVTYRMEYKSCGRNCRKCPHGPYWYAYWWMKGRTRSRYIGKSLPRDVEILPEAQAALRSAGEAPIPSRRRPAAEPPPPPPRKPMTEYRAYRILGGLLREGYLQLQRRWQRRRKAVLAEQPYDPWALAEIDEAWAWIEARLP